MGYDAAEFWEGPELELWLESRRTETEEIDAAEKGVE